MIVVATDQEVALAKEVLGDAYYENLPLMVVGVGGANVVRHLQAVSKDTPILNIGYVGSPNIERGTVLNISQCRAYHPNVDYSEPVFHLSEEGVECLTSNDFVLDTKERDCVFDMELLYICALGFEDVRAIKVVSDNLNLAQYDEVGTL